MNFLLFKNASSVHHSEHPGGSMQHNGTAVVNACQTLLHEIQQPKSSRSQMRTSGAFACINAWTERLLNCRGLIRPFHFVKYDIFR